MPPPTEAEEALAAAGCLEVVRLLGVAREAGRRRREIMSITMVPVQSGNVRAIGLDVPDGDAEHLIASRILVQFDNGLYECVYRGQAGTSTGEGRAAWVKGTYERFLASESKGRFYNEQIRRQTDVWRVSKLDGDTKAYVEAGGRVTIEPAEAVESQGGGIEKRLTDETQRMKDFIAGKDYRSAAMAQHKFRYGGPRLDDAGAAFDPCRDCGLPRKHPAHNLQEDGTLDPAAHLTPLKNYEGTRRLILTVGLPRSGKSTWARATGFPVVSPDAIRLVLHNRAFEQFAEPFVWAQARLMVRALFIAGHETVVLDACSVTRARRDEWRGREWETVCQVFEATRDECRRRASIPPVNAGREEWNRAATTAVGTLDAIDRMAASFEPLGEDEARHEGAELDMSNLMPEGVLAFAERHRAARQAIQKTGLPLDVPAALADDVKPDKKDGQS